MRTKVQQMLAALVLMLVATGLRAQYGLRYVIADSAAHAALPPLSASFGNAAAAAAYARALPATLQGRGYVTASLDSLRLDSASGTAWIFLGAAYRWARLSTRPEDADLYGALRWNAGSFNGAVLDFPRLRSLQERLLDRLEDNGYPFARVYLDSVRIGGDSVSALLRVDRGMRYLIDSIRVYGDLKISNELLQRHLELPNGTPYSRRRLQAVDKRLAELPYVQVERPSDLTMLNTGSILNVYLKAKRNSQVNALVGFLPNPDAGAAKKLLVTGEANLLLRNGFGGGETIGLNWQQLQQSSPRLHLLFEQPYFLRSPLGFGVDFEMFRKDTTFLNLTFDLTARYRSGKGVASLFFQRRSSVVNGVNVQQVLAQRRLPVEADVASNNLGAGYDWNGTDYRFNPRRGSEFKITASAGIKKLRPSTQVVELKDPGDPAFSFAKLYDTVKLRTYQFRVLLSGAHYFPLGRQSTLRTAINAGAFASGSVYRNELFQVGGYKLLRGFDEESEYLSQYAITTAEFRYLIGQNSHFFVFADGGWGRQPEPVNANRFYLGTGLGISLETKAGIFNLAWAIGRRDDVPFNLRKSKVHLGYVSYF
ncbi:BamA/TamA family outer membrane protein [Flaviaesturariibacter aridisoli]|uniref:BamA/TamA family outer membrane protein n=1 Tax=Flaviaesturariibacter aridisoli TaxID=2545761 RepID=UPI0014048608|nr:BamA/TamA family outer membrane protein [Flaviaesturariibacter aridisoli]